MKEIIHEGLVVSVDHLAPMTFNCPCSEIERDLVIAVSFANHCYTKAFNETGHSSSQITLYDAGSRPRVFCPIRHALSHKLPELVRSLPGRKVFQTAEQRNYVFAIPLEVEGQNYEIYFMVQRAESMPDVDLKVTVESAYPVDNPSAQAKRARSIRFKVLAHKVLRREKIRFAPR